MSRADLVKRLKAKGVRQPIVTIEEARRADILVASALAMMQMETNDKTADPRRPGFRLNQRNVFGCDHGSQGGRPPYCGDNVTEARVHALMAMFPGTMNGVGWTQLTWYELVREAERMGGAHIPRFQMRVGFRQLRENFERFGSLHEMFRAYNGEGPAAEAYGRYATTARSRWLTITKE